MNPNVFSYVDARAFISDQINQLKELGNYSTRSFAREIGLGSPDYIRRIIVGERKISEEIAGKLAKAFGLSGVEAQFFKKLVHFTQAKTETEKSYIWKQLDTLREKKDVRKFSYENYRFYHNWKISVLMEGLKSQWSRSTMSEIASELGVSTKEIEDHLNALKELKILEGTDGNWTVTQGLVQSEQETESQLVRGFHRTMLKKAAHSLDELPTEQRKFYNLTFSMPASKVKLAAEEIFKFLEDFNLRYGQDSTADAIYNLSLQFFPLHEFKEAQSTDPKSLAMTHSKNSNRQ